HQLAKLLRGDGVDVDLRAALEAGEGGDAPLADDAPRHRHVHVHRPVQPFLVAGGGGAAGAAAGVRQVRDAGALVERRRPRLGGGGLAEDFQGRPTVPEAGEGDGVLVLGEDEVVAGGVVHGPLVVHIRVVADQGDLPVVLQTVLVNGHELLVQV